MPKRSTLAAILVSLSALFGLAGASAAKDTPKRDACFNSCQATREACCRQAWGKRDYGSCNETCYWEVERCDNKCRQIYD